MNSATISKRITKGEELVVIPRRAYDKFLALYEKYRWDAREREADDDIMRGKVSRGYRTKKDLKAALSRLKK